MTEGPSLSHGAHGLGPLARARAASALGYDGIDARSLIVAPRVATSVIAPCGALPLGLGGEASPGPLAEAQRLSMRYAVDR